MLPFHTTRSRLVLSSDQLEKILDKASSSPTKLSSSPVLTIFYSHPVTPDPPRFPAISALNLPTSPFPIATHPISPWSYPPHHHHKSLPIGMVKCNKGGTRQLPHASITVTPFDFVTRVEKALATCYWPPPWHAN